MAFGKGWQYPNFRRLGFLGIRPADYVAIVKVRGGVVREVIATMFYSTGARQITSASVILVEQFSDTDVGNTAAMDNEHGIALCSGLNLTGGLRYVAIGIATKRHPQRISLDLSCVTSFEGCSRLKGAPTSETCSIPKTRQNTAQLLNDLMGRARQRHSGSIQSNSWREIAIALDDERSKREIACFRQLISTVDRPLMLKSSRRALL
jgi:hypothetical protein